MALFVMGFVADPIINLYVDPYSVISSAPFSKVGARLEPMLTDDDVTSWTEHFLKGLASLGLLGFVKVLFALSPWQWWNIRTSGIMNGGGRSGNTGRDRLASISWVVVIIGIATFLLVCVVDLRVAVYEADAVYRLFTKVFAHGVAELWKKQGKRSWMLQRTTMMTMTRPRIRIATLLALEHWVRLI